jgi:hypothetical protein
MEENRRRRRRRMHWFETNNKIPVGGPRFMLKFKLIYDGRSVGQAVLVLGSHKKFMTRFLSSVWQLLDSWCGASSLTRGCVCNLLVQLLLGLARAVILGTKSRRTHDHILSPNLTVPKPGGPGSRIYIPQEQRGPVIPPGTGFPFRRILRLAGLRWRYSNPRPHGNLDLGQCNKHHKTVVAR